MKIEVKLARVFRAVAEQEQQMESTASAIIAIVTSIAKLTLAKFDALVRDAYAENGWNTRPGRPQNGNVAEAVPSTVRTYVTVVRRAIRAKMKIGKYKTFSALRTAVETRSGRKRSKGKRTTGTNGVLKLPAPIAESFVGVEIEKAEPNGALFHDLAVLFAKLPAEPQALLGRQLNQLYHKYLPLGLASAKPARKAA